MARAGGPEALARVGKGPDVEVPDLGAGGGGDADAVRGDRG